jgi:BirA family transcriptional regulator, biotin operon repressor / biotin---[acetyl-CoA-carboxylase] ligase
MADGDRIWPGGWHVTVVESTGSTNTDLMLAAAAGAPGRTVLAAGFQSQGRGRLDRTWVAPPGVNLLVSVLLRTDDGTAIPQRVAVAAARAAERFSGRSVALKWPNDLLVDGAKLAGILAQGAPGVIVVGVGMNVGWAPAEAARLGEGIDPLDVLAAMLAEYDGLADDVPAEYRRRLTTIGTRVRVELADRVVEGHAVDLDPDGSLVVRDAQGTRHRFATGDVVHLRPGS